MNMAERLRKSNWIEESKKGRESFLLRIRKEKRTHAVGIKRQMNSSLKDKQQSDKENTLLSLPSLKLHVDKMASNIRSAQLESVTYFRRMLSYDFNPPIDVVVQCGVVPSFVNFLATASNVKEKIEVLCCLTNIACGSDTVIELLLECNIVSVLLNILQTDFTLTVRERCYWMASNLSHSLDRSRHLLISEGILDLILEELGLISSSRILPRPSLGLLRIIVWTLCNLSSSGKENLSEDILTSVGVAFSLLIHCQDSDCIFDLLQCISGLCELSTYFTVFLFENGVFSRVRDLCEIGVIPIAVPKPTEYRISGNERVLSSFVSFEANQYFVKFLSRSNTIPMCAIRCLCSVSTHDNPFFQRILLMPHFRDFRKKLLSELLRLLCQAKEANQYLAELRQHIPFQNNKNGLDSSSSEDALVSLKNLSEKANNNIDLISNSHSTESTFSMMIFDSDNIGTVTKILVQTINSLCKAMMKLENDLSIQSMDSWIENEESSWISLWIMILYLPSCCHVISESSFSSYLLTETVACLWNRLCNWNNGSLLIKIISSQNDLNTFLSQVFDGAKYFLTLHSPKILEDMLSNLSKIFSYAEFVSKSMPVLIPMEFPDDFALNLERLCQSESADVGKNASNLMDRLNQSNLINPS